MPEVDSRFPDTIWPTPTSPMYLPAFLEPPAANQLQRAESTGGADSAASADSISPAATSNIANAENSPSDDMRPIRGSAIPQTLVDLPRDIAGAGNSPLAELSAGQASHSLRVRRIAPATASAGAATSRPLAEPHDLRALSAVWNSLAGAVPFRSFEWMESWWRHYQLPGSQTYLLAVEDSHGQIVGIAPWFVSRSPISGRTVQFLGSGEACSEYQTILAVAGQEQSVAAAVADWLWTDGAHDWDLLWLSGAAAADRTIASFADEFKFRGHVVHQRPGMPCWRAELPASWEEFVRGLSKSRRERLRQLTRKYFDSGRTQTRWVASPTELDAAFSMFVDMHQRRRKSLGQLGCYSSERFARFHAEVSRRQCAAGKLRLLWTELDGRPVGAEYDFIDGQTVYYYSTGVEPAAVADHPGWLAMIGSLRRAIDEGCRSFDFLRGDEAYKCSWGAKPEPTLETRIIARRNVARLRHKAWLGRQQIRQWAKGVKQLAARKPDKP